MGLSSNNEGRLKKIVLTNGVSYSPTASKRYLFLHAFVSHITGTATTLYMETVDVGYPTNVTVYPLLSVAAATGSENFGVPRGYLGNAAHMADATPHYLEGPNDRIRFTGNATAYAVVYGLEFNVV